MFTYLSASIQRMACVLRAIVPYLACGGLALAAMARAEAAQPNVIVIIGDDNGYADFGFQGSTEMITPNLDTLASNGVRCTNAYVSCPYCSPTRAGILTGRQGLRFGHEFNFSSLTTTYTGLPLSEITLAQQMKGLGYNTGMVGKWHEGGTEPYRPLNRGFDEYYGFLSGSHPYLSEDSNNPIYRNDTPIPPSEFPAYLTDAFGDEAAAYIDRHKSDANPFFLYLTFNATHLPLEARPEDLALFPTLTGDRQIQAAMMYAMDRNVGKVKDELAAAGLTDNTLIVFCSDNGGPVANGSSNGVLHGQKGQTYEGGIRVPYFVTGPGIPVGQQYDGTVSSMDFFPTIVAAAGGTMPTDPLPGGQARVYDGVNLLPYLNGQDTSNPHETLYWELNDWVGIRKGDWKMVQQAGPKQEIFNLATDISELNDLSASNPGKVLELLKDLISWQAGNPKPLWVSSGAQGTQGFLFTYNVTAGGNNNWAAAGKWTANEDGGKTITMVDTDVHPNNILRFPTRDDANYTANCNVKRQGDQPHFLNQLQFTGTFAGTAAHSATLGVVASNPTSLMFVQNSSGQDPQIVMSATKSGTFGFTFNLNTPIILFAELQLTGNGTETFNIGSPISDYTSLGQSNGLVKSGSCTVSLTGTSANSYLGLTRVNDGLLQLNKTSAIGVPGDIRIGDGAGAAETASLKLLQSHQIADTSAVELMSDGLLSINGQTETIGRLSGNGVVRLGSGQLTFGDASDGTLDGTLCGNQGSGGVLVKQGSGTQTMEGSLQHTGATTVHEGKLLINGTITATSQVTVDPGATLGGRGTITTTAGTPDAVHILGGGTLSPGASIDTLTLYGDVTLDGGAVLWSEIGSASASDLLVVNGNLTLGSGALLHTEGIADGSPYTLVSFTGSLTGEFDLLHSALPAGYQIEYGPHSINLVPEPSTIALLLSALAGCLVVAIRRRRKLASLE